MIFTKFSRTAGRPTLARKFALTGGTPLINVFLLTTLLFISLNSVAAGQQCHQIFFRDPFQKQQMTPKMATALVDSVKNLAKSTTGARIEKKWTLITNKVSVLIDSLAKDLSRSNIMVSARDKVTPGTKNVTHTVYLDQFKLNLKETGLEISAEFDLTDVTMKPRIRKYGKIRNENAVAIENIEFADFTKDYSFVEFKFPDARFKGAVFKPRMYMADKYIALFGTPEFTKHFDSILRETKALELNKSTPDTVEAMMRFFMLGQQSGAKFGKVAVNLYERISYAVDFFDQTANSKFQIQMTLDKSISLLVYELGRTIQAYQPEHSVIEIKIPVEYANVKLPFDLLPSMNKLRALTGNETLEVQKMTDLLATIPGYETFLNFVSSVQKSHLKDEYMEGVGKNGHGHRGYLRETDKARAEK